VSLSLLPNQRHNTQHGWKGKSSAKVKGNGGADSLPEDTMETSKQKKLGSQG